MYLCTKFYKIFWHYNVIDQFSCNEERRHPNSLCNPFLSLFICSKQNLSFYSTGFQSSYNIKYRFLPV